MQGRRRRRCRHALTISDDGSNRLTVDFYPRQPAKYALARTVCNGPLEDDGRELRARCLANGLLMARTNRPRKGADDSGGRHGDNMVRDVRGFISATRRQKESDTDMEGILRSP